MKTRRRSRIGFTLIEMIAAMFILGIAMTIGISTILYTMKINKEVAKNDLYASRKKEMIDAFRGDVACARNVDLKEQVLTIVLDKGRITYSIESGIIRRTETKRDQNPEREGTPESENVQELELREGTSAVFTKDASNLITLRLIEKNPIGDLTQTLEISGALGSNRR